MVNVRVGADNRTHRETVTLEPFEDALDLVARIDHQRLARLRIAQNRAVALQHADRKDLVNQFASHLETIACGSGWTISPRTGASLSRLDHQRSRDDVVQRLLLFR